MATPFWYNAALALIKPLYQARIRKRADNPEQLEQELCERFGPFQHPKNTSTMWFHVVSVGETNAAQPIIEHYLKQGQRVLVTNTTKTGQARAKALFEKAPYLDQFQAVYLPADQKHLIRDFFKKYQPKILLLMETELWPNLIDQAQEMQVPCILLNARLSAKSAKGYNKVKSLTRAMLQGLTQLLTQDQASFQRFIDLGAHANTTHVVGSVKFDIVPPLEFIKRAHDLKQVWQLQQRKVMLLASTHAPEEQAILSALKSALHADPSLLCIVVPRHPERFDDVFQITHDLNLRTQRRSLNEDVELNTQVYLADSMGELWLWYALSQACYVGGSLNEPGGGHNILEPIACGVPTVLGHNYFNFQTIVDEFVAEKAIEIVENADGAARTLLNWVTDATTTAQFNHAAALIMQRNQGSLQKHLQIIDQYL